MNWTQWQNLTDYRIYTKSGSDGSFVWQKTLAALTYTMKKCKDTDQKKYPFATGETYQFRVRAVYPDGTCSDYSNVLSITFQPNDTANTTTANDVTPTTETSETTESTEPASTETTTEVQQTESQPTETGTESTGTETQPTETGTESTGTETQPTETGTESTGTEIQPTEAGTEN